MNGWRIPYISIPTRWLRIGSATGIRQKPYDKLPYIVPTGERDVLPSAKA